jgi:hypothetical protein
MLVPWLVWECVRLFFARRFARFTFVVTFVRPITTNKRRRSNTQLKQLTIEGIRPTMTNHQADHSAKSLNDPSSRAATSRRQDGSRNFTPGMDTAPEMSLNELLLPTLNLPLSSSFARPNSFLVESMSMRDLLFDSSSSSSLLMMRGDNTSTQRQGLADILNTALAILDDDNDDDEDNDDDLFFNYCPTPQRSSQQGPPPPPPQ